VLSRTVGRLIVITGTAVAIVMVARFLRSEPAPILDSMWTVLRSRAYHVVALAAIILNTRDIVFRLTERDLRS
jgi:hypothetical protein